MGVHRDLVSGDRAGPRLAAVRRRLTTAFEPNSPQPNLGAPNETPVESDKVTQGVAQAPSDQGVFAPIVVTAQKRREKIQDVGISITALSGETIKTLNLSNMQQISQQVPNLQVSAWTPAFTTFNLRGISQNNFQDNLEAPVAVYHGRSLRRQHERARACRSSTSNGSRFCADLREPCSAETPPAVSSSSSAIWRTRRGSTAMRKANWPSWNTWKLEGAIGGQLAPGIRARVAGCLQQVEGLDEGRLQSGSFGLNPLGPHQALGRTSQGTNG